MYLFITVSYLRNKEVSYCCFLFLQVALFMNVIRNVITTVMSLLVKR